MIRVNLLIGAFVLTLSRICTFLDARRTASELEELVSQIPSSKACGLYWNPELGLSCLEAESPLNEIDSAAPNLSFDKNIILRAICRMNFPGLEQQKVRDLLSLPFDMSSAESPRRNSVSLSPAVVVEASAFVNSGSEGTDSSDYESDHQKDEGKRDSGLSAADVEVVLSDDAPSEAENEETHHLSETRSQVAQLDRFEHATRIYRRKTVDRISSVRKIYALENDEPDSLENLLRTASLDDGPGRRWKDAALVSPLSAGKNASVVLRRESRSSVLMLPDNPEPMLNAQQMLSDLDGTDSQAVQTEGPASNKNPTTQPSWKQTRASRVTSRSVLSISVTNDDQKIREKS